MIVFVIVSAGAGGQLETLELNACHCGLAFENFDHLVDRDVRKDLVFTRRRPIDLDRFDDSRSTQSDLLL
jgi:hypothetical protein